MKKKLLHALIIIAIAHINAQSSEEEKKQTFQNFKKAKIFILNIYSGILNEICKDQNHQEGNYAEALDKCEKKVGSQNHKLRLLELKIKKNEKLTQREWEVKVLMLCLKEKIEVLALDQQHELDESKRKIYDYFLNVLKLSDEENIHMIPKPW